MKSLTTSIALVLLFFNPIFSQTIVSEGEVTGLWRISESPFIIDGNINVPVSGKLTIDPGVEVLFSGSYLFEIFGRLDATGNLEDSIYFGMTDTTGFSTNDYEGWVGMAFMNTTGYLQEPSLLDYVIVGFSASSGIFCYNTALNIQNSKINHNKGFGLCLVESADLFIEKTHLSYNLLGGLTSQNSAPFMSDFVISNNSGTGIQISGNTFNSSQAIFQHGEIMNNNSVSYGGGVYVGMEAYIIMSDISIESNSAIKGGGIFCDMGGIELDNSKVSFNAAQFGGGLNIDSWSNISINNTLIADNQAYQSGGAIWVSNSSVSINRSTVANNIAGETGSGIVYEMIENRINTISNSILWENYPQEIITFDAQPEIQYSDIMGGFEGYNVIDADPLFVDIEDSDYHLQWNEYPAETGFKSPAIDSGDPMVEYDPDGTIADMGAFYFEQMTVTGTNEKNLVYELSVYPNPVQESFTVNSDQNINRIQISNLSGQVVKVIENVESNTRLNISNFEKGIYLLNIYFENSEVGTETLIKN